jgi:hypothetical protein
MPSRIALHSQPARQTLRWQQQQQQWILPAAAEESGIHLTSFGGLNVPAHQHYSSSNNSTDRAGRPPANLVLQHGMQQQDAAGPSASNHQQRVPLSWPSREQFKQLQQQQQQCHHDQVLPVQPPRDRAKSKTDQDYQRQLLNCNTWQQLQQMPLTGPYFKPQYFAAVAVTAARLLRQQAVAATAAAGPHDVRHSSSSNKTRGSSGSHRHAPQQLLQNQTPVQLLYASRYGTRQAAQHQERHRQQRQEAAALWHWWNSAILGRCIKLGYVQQHAATQPAGESAPGSLKQQRQQPVPLSAVTASIMLQATATMGWAKPSIRRIVGEQQEAGKSAAAAAAADKQLTGSCLSLLEFGLAAALQPQDDSNSSRLACPSIAAVNMIIAVQTMGVKLHREQLLQQKDAVLLAAYCSSGSSSCGSGTDSRDSSSSNGVGFATTMALLASCIAVGSTLSEAVLSQLCISLQVNLANH